MHYATLLSRQPSNNGIDASQPSLGLKSPSNSLSRVVEYVVMRDLPSPDRASAARQQLHTLVVSELPYLDR